MRSLIFFLLLALPWFFQGDDDGWQANPEQVEQLTQERPQYNWQEENVPGYELPDPLQAAGVDFVSTPSEWGEHREEILDLFRTHVYGRRPGAPDQLQFETLEEDSDAMDGAATLKRIRIQSQHDGREHHFEVALFLPNNEPEPVPLFLLMNNRDVDNTDPTRQEKSDFWPVEEVVARGYGIAALQNNDLAPDDSSRFREGVISLFEDEDTERSPDSWASLAAWGWGASRVMDYLHTDRHVNGDRVAVVGHSRGGKAALWAGAEDERFALTISNNSGAGGAALSRRKYGETVRALNDRFPHWFASNFSAYNDREGDLPVDQHLLISLMAPRAVYVASADEDLWADPRGEFLSLAHASPVYGLWNHPPIRPTDMPSLDSPLVAGPRGYHIRSGGHNLTLIDWQHYMDFADQLWEEE